MTIDKIFIKLKGFFKRLYYRFLIQFKKYSQKNARQNSDNEQILISICRKLINHQNSKFLIAPLSGKRYIKNSTLGLFIIMDEGKISLTNHVYHYDIILAEKEWKRLTRMYDNRTERDRETYESEIKSQIVHSLSSILDKVSKEDEKTQS